MFLSKMFSLELKLVILGLCIYLSNAQRGHQRGNSHGPPQHQNNNHGPPPHQNTNSHGPPPSHRMSNSHGPPPSHRMSNSHGPPPTHRMVNSHGPPSQGGSHQLSSGHHIADPIEQRDPVRTTPMSVPRGRAGGALPPPPPPRNSVGGHSRGVQYHAPTYPPTHAPRHRPRPRPKPTTRKDPIVHARTTTPEPPKPTEAGEVEYENEGGSTTVGYQGGGRGGGGGGRRNQRRNQQGGGGYYNDYYNYHDRTKDKGKGSNKTSGNGSRKTSDEEFQGACPRFKETIIDHHVILRQHGCEIVISQDDAIRGHGSPGFLPPIAFARNI